MAAHDLQHHHTVMAGCCGMQPVDRVGGNLKCGVETERSVGAGEIVIDRLGDTNYRRAHLCKLKSDPLCTLAADRDQTIETDTIDVLKRFEVGIVLGADHALAAEMALISGLQDRAAERQDTAYIGAGQHFVVRFADQALEALGDAQHLIAPAVAGLHYSANNGVQARRVASAREYCNPAALSWFHGCLPRYRTFIWRKHGAIAGGGRPCPRRAPRER